MAVQLTEKDLESKIGVVLTSLLPSAIKDAIKEIKPEKTEPLDGPPPRETVKGGEPMLAKDPKGGFKGLWDFASCIWREAKYRTVDPRLPAWREASKALSTVTSDAAGDLIPIEFSTALIGNVIQVNPILPQMTTIRMSTGKVSLPFIKGFDLSGGLVYGGIRWYWLAEGDAGTESEPKVETFDMTLHDLMGLIKVTQNLMDDSPVSIEGILQSGFTSGLNFKLNDAFYRGTGAGQPLGIKSSPALITVAKETNQTAGTINSTNIFKMRSRLYVGPNGGAVQWLVNQDCFPQLASLSVTVGLGGAPIWIPGNSAAGRPNDTLLGYPVTYFDHCDTLGTVGDIALVNLSQYWVGLKAGIEGPTFMSSIHLEFDHNRTAFRWTYRVDGRSPWPQAFQPPHSSQSRSPFVALATRA